MRREAAAIREEWLGRALSTRPADRPAAEAAISGLYRLAGLSPPRFHWVSSPLMAVETVPPGMRHMRWENLDHVSRWSVPRALAASATELRIALDDRLSLTHRGLNGLIRQQVEGVLGRSDVVMEAFRAAHGPRSCEGAALAMVEARLVLAMMLKRFEFTSVPGPAVTPIERFVLWAAEDITMSLTPRGS